MGSDINSQWHLIRRILCHYESRPRPLRPPPLAPFHAALRSAFLACPANRVGADSTPTLATDAAGELWPSPPDITLYVQGRPIEAHRVILAARSPYFRTKLATEWRNRKEVTFSSRHSLSFKLMHMLVDFFYSDRCEVAAEDLEDFARICKACKCTGMVKRLTAHKKRRDTRTRELGRDYSQRPFVLQGRSMDHRAEDGLPSALRRILHDSLANSREEDLRNSELAETCRSSAYDDLADVCIKVGDRVFRCHQLILTLRSEYFKTRLSRRTDFLHSNGGELPLLEEHDVSAEAFEKMLEYVYTDELEDLDDDDPLSMAEELFDIASRYLLFPLKRVVADLLLPHLDLDLVSPAEICRWLMLSDMYDVAKVREHCQDIIDRNFEAFAESQGSSGPCF
ncbi:hypothetical protein QYE76_009276 [Lolium multiflorum]|uniref:BTB domain-containing protein n=1 Tax=Lolium multiflorum TaxID=4521 RepID=A0AAD8TUQ5_LOLMU|nr:hypothetical protein QYE76_009276 [Lolium multiflorum]